MEAIGDTERALIREALLYYLSGDINKYDGDIEDACQCTDEPVCQCEAVRAIKTQLCEAYPAFIPYLKARANNYMWKTVVLNIAGLLYNAFALHPFSTQEFPVPVAHAQYIADRMSYAPFIPKIMDDSVTDRMRLLVRAMEN